jgi:peptidoglycan hydrolase-like protein with peptidoglycan-binding domain
MKNRILTRTAAALLLGAAFALPASAIAATPEKSPAPATATHHHKISAREKSEIESAQTALNKQGANLAVDGRLGPKTREAIKTFQAAHGLKATGKLDKATRTALGAQ